MFTPLALCLQGALDADGNGSICFDEFYRYILGMGAIGVHRARKAYQADVVRRYPV